jgi:hypothetical protein
MNEDYFGYTYAGLAEAFLIFAKYTDGTFDLSAEHDQIWAGDNTAMSEEDALRLEELYWNWDEDIERWRHGA